MIQSRGMLARLRGSIPLSLSLVLLFPTLLSIATVEARPPPSDELKDLLEARYHYLSERDCANPCWGATTVCCGSGQTCGTDSQGQAYCSGGGGGGGGGGSSSSGQNEGWQFYTTTIVTSGALTITTTYSTYFGASPTPAAISGISCDGSLGEKPCGGICCATGQYCLYAGQCAASNGNGDESSSAYLGSIFTPTPAPTPLATPTNTAPIRPTSNAATTVTSTGSATTTVPFATPSAMASGAAGMTQVSSNNGLSGGAIAGIVIGVLIGIALLILLLACCCLRLGWDALAAFFGLGRRKRKEEVTVEEYHHHHSGGTATGGRRWWGLRPARVDAPAREKKSGVGGMTAVAGGLAALAIFLGLKRRSDRRADKSDYDSRSSYYTYSGYYSSESSESTRSGDRYTRRSGRSGPSRR